uniref:Interleukin-12 subunit alpha n=1 Tax=Seriola quinqueradiata TaxID=8161 RepID=A0A1E1G7Q0_SERQU|nr:interleukin-12p35a [Seriola quinqueradiata]
MANFNLYVASCVLLLALSCRTATGHPLPSLRTEQCEQCSLLFKSLLLNITELLRGDVLCFGITSEKVVVRSKADTLLACAPSLTQNSNCMMPRNSSFSESECLRNIMKDLAYYEDAIKSYLKSPLRSSDEEVARLSPTLTIIKSLKNCSLMPNKDNDSSEEVAAQMWGSDTYSNREQMCKMMRGFHVRAITINRAMGYISSGDHRK